MITIKTIEELEELRDLYDVVYVAESKQEVRYYIAEIGEVVILEKGEKEMAIKEIFIDIKEEFEELEIEKNLEYCGRSGVYGKYYWFNNMDDEEEIIYVHECVFE